MYNLDQVTQDDDILQKSKSIDGCLKYFFVQAAGRLQYNIKLLLYYWSFQLYNNLLLLYTCTCRWHWNTEISQGNKCYACTKKYLRQPSIDFDFCNISSSCDVVYKGRWLTQAGYWFILRFCEHFTCLSSNIQNA
jgi:hypothetical protein